MSHLAACAHAQTPLGLRFKKVNDKQEKPYIYPPGLTQEEVETKEGSIYIFADLMKLEPPDHVVTLSFEVRLVYWISNQPST